jgi:hypothetical protein
MVADFPDLISWISALWIRVPIRVSVIRAARTAGTCLPPAITGMF